MFSLSKIIKFSSLLIILSTPAIGQEFLDRNGVAIDRGEASPIQFLKKDLTSLEKGERLSFDVELNRIVYEKISSGVREYRAKRSAGFIMDINTGEILAMASVEGASQTYTGDDPIDELMSKQSPQDGQFNLVSQGVYEIGFAAKAITAAMALDAGKINVSSMLDARKPIRIGKYEVDDFKPTRKLMNVSDVMLHASNIGLIQIQRKLGSESFHEGLKTSGMLDELKIDGLLTSSPATPAAWSELTTVTIAYGHGLGITPIQAGAAMAAIANGGYEVRPTIFKADDTQKGRRIISEKTSEFMRSVMRRVIVEGSGQNANMPNVEIGGLTNTANKRLGDRYLEDHVVSSFVGVFPIDRPRYLVFTLLDDPQPTEDTNGYRTAGWNAAPLAAEIISQMK